MITVCRIAVILFVGYVSFIGLYYMLYNQSLDDAKKAVDKLIKNGIKNYIFNETVSQEPVPDEILLNKLWDIIKKVNMLQVASTEWKYCPNYYGFPAICFDIVASAETDFDLLAIQLKKVTENYLQLCRLAPFVYVFCEKCGDAEYNVYVCYACFSSAQTAMQNFIASKAGIEKKDCIKKEAPIVNDVLEKELEDMKNGIV